VYNTRFNERKGNGTREKIRVNQPKKNKNKKQTKAAKN
jgi:hypothetical protein